MSPEQLFAILDDFIARTDARLHQSLAELKAAKGDAALLPQNLRYSVSGDVTRQGGIVWSRTDRPARMLVDVAEHGHGPAIDWFRAARPGWRLLAAGPRSWYDPAADASRHVLAGDAAGERRYAAVVATAIWHSFDYDRDFDIPVEDIRRNEDDRTRALAAAGA